MTKKQFNPYFLLLVFWTTMLVVLVVLLSASGAKADIQVRSPDTGLVYYAHVQIDKATPPTVVHRVLTETAIRSYVATAAELDAAGLPATTSAAAGFPNGYPFSVNTHATNSYPPTFVGEYPWSGTAELARPSNLAASDTAALTAIGTAVWSSATRILTAATNITSTGGTTVPQTGDAFARIGAAGAGLTAIPWNSAWDAEVESEVTDSIVANGLDDATPGAISITLYLGSVDPDPEPYTIIQGEAKTITVLSQAKQTFADPTPTAITVTLVDKTGAAFVIDNADIDRITEHANFQVFSFTIPEDDTSAMAVGFATIQVQFDTEKAKLLDRIKIEEGF